MSHNPTFRVFDASIKPEKIESSLAEFVRHACYQEGGRLMPIKWEEKIFNSYEDAESYIKERDNGWYDNRAVLFKDVEGISSKKIEDIKMRISELYSKKSNLQNKKHFVDVKSSLIGCKSCGSKIASEYMKTRNNCPVCCKTMLPETVLKKISGYADKISALEIQIKEEQKKMASKASLKRLVYFDYHT